MSQKTANEVYQSMQTRKARRNRKRNLPGVNMIIALIAALRVHGVWGDAGEKTDSEKFDKLCAVAYGKRPRTCSLSRDEFDNALANRILDLSERQNADGSLKHPGLPIFGLTPRTVTVDSLVSEFDEDMGDEDSAENI